MRRSMHEVLLLKTAMLVFQLHMRTSKNNLRQNEKMFVTVFLLHSFFCMKLDKDFKSTDK